MSQQTLDIETRRMTQDDEPAVVELLTAALGAGPTGDRSLDFFAWKHRQSPFGASPGLVAVHDKQLVGVRLFLRWELESAGQRVQAVRAVDTATDPSFQGRGIFRRLTLELLHHLEAAGEVDLVFNTPNANSLPGYLKMGWQPVGLLPIRIRPVRPMRLVRGVRAALGSTAMGSSRVSGGRAIERSPLPACPFEPAAQLLRQRGREVAELAAGVDAISGLHTRRSLTYLSWRYGAAPGLDYRAFTVESGGELTGVGIGRLRHRGPLSEFTLSELLVRQGDGKSLRRLLRAATASGGDHVAVHSPGGSALEQAARLSGFLTVPRNGVQLVANSRRDTVADALAPSSWHLSLGDVEVF